MTTTKSDAAREAVFDDPTKLYVALANVYEGHPDDELFSNMPRCTTKALVELLMDDDVGDDIQFRAERRLAAEAMAALAKALLFAKIRLACGNEIDVAHARGIDELLSKAGVVLTP